MWKKRGIYYDRVNGEIVSLKTGIAKDAKLELARLRAKSTDPTSKKKIIGLADAIEGMIGQKIDGGKAEGTQDMYGWKGERLIGYFGKEFNPRKFELTLVEKYCRYRLLGGMEPHPIEPPEPGKEQRPRRPVIKHTIAKELVCLRQTLKWCKKRGYWEGDVEALIPEAYSSSHYVPVERNLEVEEVEKMQDGCTTDQQLIYLLLVVATSARHAEVKRVCREDFDLDLGEFGHLWLRGSKTEESKRLVPLTQHTRRWIDIVLAKTEQLQADEVFITKKFTGAQFLDRIAAKVGVEPVSPNDLRRTFATWLAKAGVPLKLIAEACGHKDDRMVQKVYAKFGKDGSLGMLINAKLAEAPGRALAKKVAKHKGKLATLPKPVKKAPGADQTAAETAAGGDKPEGAS